VSSAEGLSHTLDATTGSLDPKELAVEMAKVCAMFSIIEEVAASVEEFSPEFEALLDSLLLARLLLRVVVSCGAAPEQETL